MLKALWKTYWKELGIAMLLNLFRCIFLMIQPILITSILDFIQAPKDEDKGLAYGIGLVAAYIVIDLIGGIIIEQFSFVQSILGVNSSHALTAIIYEKVL
mmetsp:Transcript_42725/g.50048  ORF Transcript_42725/g.50048 Transcript_42725/m.50048 type:complete len:100 (+) Transcript_42725:346-645(+)